MKRLLRLLVVVPLLMGFVASTGLAGDYKPVSPVSRSEEVWEPVNSPPGELILADAIFLRPLGIVACAVGMAGTIITFPFSATSRSEDRVGRELLEKPFDYTFRRPLGDVDY
jgi:hypothetical protein